MISQQEFPIFRILKIVTLTFSSFVLLVLLSTKSTAQENSSTEQEKPLEMKVDYIEKPPLFPGGINKFYKFVGKNYKTNEEAVRRKVGGVIYTQFVIEKDGTLADIKILDDIGYGSDDEAIRVLKLSPKWIPGSIKGEPVRVLYRLPITLTPGS